MDSEQEKFFEELARERTKGEPQFEVELAKARTSAVRTKPTVRPMKTRDDAEMEGTLTIDVYQTPAEIVVESAIAGVDPKDLDITATNDSVVIKGERHREREVNDDNYFYQECYCGKFSRSVILPQEVDPEEAIVSFKNGILTIRLPKLERQKTRRLSVRED